MGLPKININFFGSMKKLEKRDPAGIVALILKDADATKDFFIYKDADAKFKDDSWSDENVKFIKDAFKGGPRSVMVARIDAIDGEYSTAFSTLKNKRFNYLAVPQIESGETEQVTDWIKKKRDKDKKKLKAVIPSKKADHESIINFTSEDIKVGEKTYSAAEYTPRIAGILAGLPFTRSATYFVLDEVDSVKEKEDADDAIDNGELILVDDGEQVKIGRGVNSLTTVEEPKDEQFKSIRVVEIMDMIHDEIYDNFNKHYIGKVPNTYDNQVLFISEVIKGFKELSGLQLLDSNAENYAEVDVAAQKRAWENVGVDTTDWDDEKTKKTTFKRNVFLKGKIKIIDTMEDIDFNITI